MGRVHASKKGAPKKAKGHTVRFFRASGHNGLFSNFSESPNTKLIYNGKPFPTSEHIYQANKYDYEGAPAVNAEMIEAIRQQNTPNKAFMLARGFGSGSRYEWGQKLVALHKSYIARGVKVNPKWDEVKVARMHAIIELKFKQDAEFAKELVATKDATIEEESPYDKFWGTGADGKGRNELGKILMKVRDSLGNKGE